MMFKAGDVVQLKSGGPLMTVSAVSTVPVYNDQPEYQRVWVVWFDTHDRMCSDELRNYYLEKVE
jgi:uncharacterized protein YodC (DUF2158 family)